MRDRRRANFAQGFDKTRISLTAARVRYREGWADRDPDLGTWRPGQPTARSIQPIRTKDDRRNNRSTSDAREGGCATLRCSAPENGGSASAYAAFGKDSYNSSGTQALDSDAESTVVWSRTVHWNGVKCTEPRPHERVRVKFLSRHPIDWPREGVRQKKRIKMRDVIGHNHCGGGRSQCAGSAPDMQPGKRPQQNVAQHLG